MDLLSILRKRSKLLALIFTLIFILLGCRLYYIQFIQGDELIEGALRQRGKEILLSPKRGIIFDRNTTPLTNSQRVPTLIIQKDQLLEDKELFKEVQSHTILTLKEFRQRINSDDYLLSIPMEDSFKLDGEVNRAFLVDIVNRYDEDNLLAHVIGYINKADNRGQAGIEKVFDEYLNIEGQEAFVLEYDKSRRLILDGKYHVDKDFSPHNPAGVKLTIDKRVQEIVEEVLDEAGVKGAVIVADAKTSQILAMASRPNFDQDKVYSYFKDENMALYNKAIQVGYPPGSIFKIVVLLTALEKDPALIKDQYYCQGFEEINGIRINCTGHHGNLSLEEGFAKSCNSVFIQLAQDVGAKDIMEMARTLGFGQKVNIGLLEEDEGNLPKEDEIHGAAIGNIALGQGKIQVTPLQVTNLMLTIVNGGVSNPLQLVEGITNRDGLIIKEYQREKEARLLSNKSSLKAMDMLRQVVKEGTARYMDLDQLGGCGGKTGSAEGILKQREVIHGWFTGFFPARNPQYVVTVLVEEAFSGAQSAAPIFEEIIKELEYFR